MDVEATEPPAEALAAEPPSERATLIVELVRCGWADRPEDGRIDVAAGHLLEHLCRALGANDARTFLVDAALKALLLGYEYQNSGVNFIDLVEDRLVEAYEDFALDSRRVAEECLAGEPDEGVRAALSELQDELARGEDSS